MAPPPFDAPAEKKTAKLMCSWSRDAANGSPGGWQAVFWGWTHRNTTASLPATHWQKVDVFQVKLYGERSRREVV